ncbi:phage tail protein [Staphylococcus pseudintermedius]|nr:phage tail protein [Staphylococcus pseudintermedius]
MYQLILTDKKETFAEIITEFDYGSFKREYEKNNERSISFTAYKTNKTADIFDLIINEHIVIYNNQHYVIKSTDIKYNGIYVSVDVVAKHIFMEFQNHYIQKDIEDEELNNEEVSEDSSNEESKPTITLQQYLDFGFNNNKLGFTYQIKGEFTKRVAIDELGNKNGLEYLTEGAELFNYIYYADNKTIYIYDEASFYELSDEPIIYKLNNDEVQATITTTELKTYIQGYGKKKSKSETKNYKPMKPKDLNYNGAFTKEKTWYTEEIGAYYYKDFECKWGNETLEFTLKKMSKGGNIDIYLDNTLVGQYDCYSKTTTTEKIILAKELTKGKHTFKAVFRGAKSGVDYGKSKPCMYVGTDKSTVINLTAILKGTDIYHAYAEYKSPNYEVFGHAEAPTVFDDSALDDEELLKNLKSQLQDEPTVEVSTNYLGNWDIKDNNSMMFIHKPLGFETELKVVKITESHPYLKQPVQVEFSNAKLDFIQLQQQSIRKIKQVDRLVKGGALNRASFSMPENYTDIVGVTLIDD